MVPLGGLSSFAHLLILLVRFAKKFFGLQSQDLKEKLFLIGLKVNPRFSLAFFSRGSWVQVSAACLILLCVFSLALASAGFMAVSALKSNSNLSLATNLIITRLAIAKAKTETVQKTGPNFTEVPFASEILQAGDDSVSFRESTLNQHILPVE